MISSIASPPRLCSLVTSMISLGLRGGSRLLRAWASMVLPDPGDPESRMLCLPATAMATARLACS